MPSILDAVHVEASSVGDQYQQVLATTLANLYRRKLLIIAIIAIALALGIAALLVMPKQYTAEAYIRGGFVAPHAVATDQVGSGGPVLAFDASLVVETRARLFQSHQLARQVVEDLGLERLRPLVSQGKFSSWWQDKVYGDAANAPEYQEDMAAMKLSRGLLVKTEPRVYLITLSYTAADPELAALITNTFVVEFLRATALQTLSEQRDSAQATLSQQLATFGDKHPKVIEARVRLATADSLFNAELGKSTEEILNGAGENIAFAQANVVPSSPKPLLVIGLAFLVGLLASIGLATWLGPRSRAGHSTPSQLRERGAPHLETQLP